MRLALIFFIATNSFALDLEGTTSQEKGHHYLTDQALSAAYGPFDLTEKEFDHLYLIWPDELKQQVIDNPDKLRELTFRRYGFTPRSYPVSNQDIPYGFTRGRKKRLRGSCLLCHSGQLEYQGKKFSYIGMPNTRLDLETFFNDRMKLRAYDKRLVTKGFSGFAFKKYRQRQGAEKFSYARGTTVPWKSVAYTLSLRTKRMRNKWWNYLTAFFNINAIGDFGMKSTSVDAPAWWVTAHKDRLYADGFAPSAGRTILVSALTYKTPTRKMLDEFNHVHAYIKSIKPPENPLVVDQIKATQGRKLFNFHCATCHGKYDSEGVQNYSAQVVDIRNVETDPARLREGITPEFRKRLAESWIGKKWDLPIQVNPIGYVAPPLVGLWASAPYFHNGSVPTVYHVLFPDERPVVWRSKDSLDDKKLGLYIDSYDEMPYVVNPNERRKYYDTTQYSLGNSGHSYPNKLSRDERMAVLEYLKTL